MFGSAERLNSVTSPTLEQGPEALRRPRRFRPLLWRGVRLGAAVGCGVGVVTMSAAVIVSIRHRWLAGLPLVVPSVATIALVGSYFLAGVVLMGAYGAALGASVASSLAIWRLIRNRAVKR